MCINEVLAADDEIRDAIMQRAPASELRKIAIKNGMTSMLEDGFEKARKGGTTVEEVLRVIRD
jgi:type II secretory ATPase GspE/PulE/Tfp pilus assembly ATPase PilB-like protein